MCGSSGKLHQPLVPDGKCGATLNSFGAALLHRRKLHPGPSLKYPRGGLRVPLGCSQNRSSPIPPQNAVMNAADGRFPCWRWRYRWLKRFNLNMRRRNPSCSELVAPPPPSAFDYFSSMNTNNRLMLSKCPDCDSGTLMDDSCGHTEAVKQRTTLASVR